MEKWFLLLWKEEKNVKWSSEEMKKFKWKTIKSYCVQNLNDHTYGKWNEVDGTKWIIDAYTLMMIVTEYTAIL